jgi:hypothetical protein
MLSERKGGCQSPSGSIEWLDTIRVARLEEKNCEMPLRALVSEISANYVGDIVRICERERCVGKQRICNEPIHDLSRLCE